MSYTSLARFRVLGMPHLHEEEFQLLGGDGLTGREEVKPVIWPPGYVITSRVAEVCVGLYRLCAPGHADPAKGAGVGQGSPTLANLRTPFSRFRHASKPLLLQACSSWSHNQINKQHNSEVMDGS